jgi:hypothetical protein
MNNHAWLLLGLFMTVLLLLVRPLGIYISRVMMMERRQTLVSGFEDAVFRVCGVQRDEDMGWLKYALAVLLFNALGLLAVYALQRLQLWLPLNPQEMANVSADSSFNTAVSFVTNTNWQGYGGESTMGYLVQMLGLTVQNFLSAATGIVVVTALIRGFARHSAAGIGNAWADLFRVTTWILLPLSLVFALFLASQGVIQNFAAYQDVTTLQVTNYETPRLDADGQAAERREGQPGNGAGVHTHPDAGHGSGCLAGGDQDARHQRRRLLQRQLGASLREPDAAGELRADAVDFPDSRRAVHCLRLHRRRRTPGLDGACRDGLALRHLCHRRNRLRAARQSRCWRRSPPRYGEREHHRLDRRQHGRQGNALRHCRFRPLRDHHHGRVLRRRQCHARFLHAARRCRAAGQ